MTTTTARHSMEASCRVALAAYLHDLGKFAERARLEVSSEALDAHKTQYCPWRSTAPGGKTGYHSHVHAGLHRNGLRLCCTQPAPLRW